MEKSNPPKENIIISRIYITLSDMIITPEKYARNFGEFESNFLLLLRMALIYERDLDPNIKEINVYTECEKFCIEKFPNAKPHELPSHAQSWFEMKMLLGEFASKILFDVMGFKFKNASLNKMPEKPIKIEENIFNIPLPKKGGEN